MKNEIFITLKIPLRSWPRLLGNSWLSSFRPACVPISCIKSAPSLSHVVTLAISPHNGLSLELLLFGVSIVQSGPDLRLVSMVLVDLFSNQWRFTTLVSNWPASHPPITHVVRLPECDQMVNRVKVTETVGAATYPRRASFLIAIVFIRSIYSTSAAAFSYESTTFVDSQARWLKL